MRRTFVPVLTVLATLLVFGCTESPLDSTTDIATPSAELTQSLGKFGDAPEESGLRVIRTSEGILISIVDFEAGLTVILGENQEELCSGTFEGDEVEFQYITNPLNDERVTQIGQGEVVATVWGLTQFTCYMFKNVEPLATGYARVGFQDNDLFGSDDPNANAFGVEATGRLNDRTTSFHAIRRCEFSDQGGRCTSEVGLQGYRSVVENPENGHFYRAFEAWTIPWYFADLFAQQSEFRACTAHLATITSQQENDFIVANFPEAVTGGYWIGGVQAPGSLEPGTPAQGNAGWGWVTGEDFSYTNWAGGEPNDAGDEEHIHFFPPYFGEQIAGRWNDQNEFNTGPYFGLNEFPTAIAGYVVEYDCD